MAQDPPAQLVGYRHFYTSATEGALGAAGFQTVACTEELLEGIEVLESLVRGYRKPDQGEGVRTRQVLQLPGDPGYCVLSTIRPTGLCPDGRPGNYWAESVVVPAPWLADALWDVDAAFAALGWRGPEAGELFGGWPCLVPAESLPLLEAGPPGRLALLREAVPEEARLQLLRALVRQGRGGPRIFVAEAPRQDPGVLDELIPLLPLALPPTLRAREHDGERRVIELRTRGHLEVEPAVDVQGLPAAALPSGRGIGEVVDLGGRRAAEPPRDDYGAAYVRWLNQVLVDNDWQKLTDFYLEVVAASHEDPIGRFAEIAAPEDEDAATPPPPGPAASESVAVSPEPPNPPAPAAVPRREPEESATPGDAWGARTDMWEALDQVDEAGWTLRRRFDGAVQQLEEALLSQIAEKEKALLGRIRETEARLRQMEGVLRQKVEAQEAAHQQELESQQATLREIADRAVDAIRAEISRAESDFRAAVRDQKNRLDREDKKKVEHLRQEVDAALKNISDQLDRGVRWVGQKSDDAVHRMAQLAEGRAVPSGDPGPPPSFERPELKATAFPETQRPPRSRGDGLAFLRQRRTRIVLAALALVVLAWTAWKLLPFGKVSEATDGTEVQAAAAPSRDDLYREAVARLREARTAAVVLQHAATVEATSRRAGQTYLSLAVGGRPFSETVTCALLQAAAGTGVDGVCGDGTRDALEAAVNDTCCFELSWPDGGSLEESRRVACFLGYRIGLSDYCLGDKPPFLPSSWKGDGESEKLLQLLRQAALEVHPSAPGLTDATRTAREQLQRDLESYDLAQGRPAEVLQGELSAEEADRLLQLVHQSASGSNRPKKTDRMTEKDLGAALAALEAWAGGAG